MIKKQFAKGLSRFILVALCLQYSSIEFASDAASYTASNAIRDIYLYTPQSHFNDIIKSLVRACENVPQYILDDAAEKIVRAIRNAQPPQPPSASQQFFKVFGAMLESANDSARAAYHSAINAGLPSEEAQKQAMEALTKGIQEAFSMLGNSIKTLYQSAGFDINALRKIITWGTVAIISIYAAKNGFDFLKEYYILKLNTPKLVRSIIFPEQITKKLDDLLYTGDTNREIQRIIKTAKGVVDNKKTGFFYKFNPWRDTSKGRARFENVMLWGPPGTGKTAIVELIAKEAGMNLFMTSGGDFAKLRGKDLQQIDELFETARNSSKPTLLFIDEMEDLFGSRSRGVSEESRQIFAKLLTEFSSPSNQIMLIGATNRPEDLDEAMHRRMPVQVEVAYPDKEGRIQIYGLYKRQLFNNDGMYNKKQLEEINTVLDDTTIAHIDELMDKISPAEIANIMGSIKNRSLTDNKGIPTQAIIDEVIKDKKKHLQSITDGFIRSDVDTIMASVKEEAISCS